MEIEKEKLEQLMKTYSTLSQNVLEKTTSEAFAAAVKESVGKSQQLADNVVNALSVGRRVVDQKTNAVEETPANPEVAIAALVQLARSVTPVAAHWRPFTDAVAEMLAVDMSDVRPKSMVPDGAKLEAAYAQAGKEVARLMEQSDALHAENAQLRIENDALKARLSESSQGEAVTEPVVPDVATGGLVEAVPFGVDPKAEPKPPEPKTTPSEGPRRRR